MASKAGTAGAVLAVMLAAGLSPAGPAASQETAAGARDVLSILATADDNRSSGLDAWQARALLQPKDEAVISAQIDARIDRLPLRDGDPVAPGDLLVRFDCALHDAELAAARAERSSAAHTLENSRRLAALNSIGALEVQLAEDALARAVARQRSAAIIVERCTINAPYGGRVVETLAHRHETVKRGQELIAILDDTALEVRLVVPSSWLPWLRPGTTFALAIDETGEVRQGTVGVIGARIDPVSQTIKLRGTLSGPTEGLIAGMSGTATFRTAVVTD